MSFGPDDEPVKSSSTEHYSRVASVLDWAIVLVPSSSIFFGFFLDIAVNPPSYFQLFDNLVLLAALYAVTTATVLFIMPVVHHMMHYRRLDVEIQIFNNKEIHSDRYYLRNASHVLRSGFIIEFQIAD